MKRSQRILGIAVMVAAFCSFLPPAGWAICVDATGHLAIEPAPQGERPCCASDRLPVEDSCSAESCPSCEDIALSAGPALRAKSDVTSAMDASPGWTATLPAVVLSEPVIEFRVQRARLRSALVPPRTLITILRC